MVIHMVIHIVYKLNSKIIDNPDFVQVNGLFGNCKLTITPTNKRHYGYTDGICVFFDGLDEYNKTYRNMLIYGADMSGSARNSNKTENFYCIGKSITQGLHNGKSIYAEHDYVKTNGSEMKKVHVLTVCYNGSNFDIIFILCSTS